MAAITKYPQTEWLRTTDIYCLSSGSYKIPKARCGQGHAPEDVNEEYVSLFSPNFGNLRHISYVSRWASFCIHLYLTSFPFNKDTSNFGLGH